MNSGDCEKECRCEVLRWAASEPNSSVRYDRVSGTYGIVSRDERHLMRIRFCFACGGRAPDQSKELFEEIDPAEERIVASSLRTCASEQDITRIFGPADRVTPGDEISAALGGKYAGVRVARQYLLYQRHWKTIDVMVHVFRDGSIQCYWAPKTRLDALRDRLQKPSDE